MPPPKRNSASALPLGISLSQILTFPLYKLAYESSRIVRVLAHHLLRLLASDINKSTSVTGRLVLLTDAVQHYRTVRQKWMSKSFISMFSGERMGLLKVARKV